MLWDSVLIWGIVLGVSHDLCTLHFNYTRLLTVFRIYLHFHVIYIFGMSYFFAQILNKCRLFSLAPYFPPPKVNLMASSHV